MDAAARPAHAGGTRPGRWSALPRTPAGAVTAKEIRMWVRDPIRLTCLLIALVVGAGVCVIPRVTAGTSALLPFAGTLTTIIAGACACNLYGSDGTSLWLTVMAPDSSRADVHGRQAAWLIVVAPYTVAVTIVFTALSGVHAAWPWVLAVLPAVLGGAAGLAPFSSLISVQPLDETGGPTPAYSLKVHIALVVVALTALVPILFLVAAGLWREPWLSWVAVPAGLATGAALAAYLGGLAVSRLQSRQVRILRVLADGPATVPAKRHSRNRNWCSPSTVITWPKGKWAAPITSGLPAVALISSARTRFAAMLSTSITASQPGSPTSAGVCSTSPISRRRSLPLDTT